MRDNRKAKAGRKAPKRASLAGLRKQASKQRRNTPGLAEALLGITPRQMAHNFAHPFRDPPRGAIMAGSISPKFPSFMGPVARRTGKIGRFGIPEMENTHIWDDLYEGMLGYQFEKRLGHLRARYPVVNQFGPAGTSRWPDTFMEHLARLHDPVANREFLKWMMEHHFRRPN